MGMTTLSSYAQTIVRGLFLSLVGLVSTGCGATMIPNTDVEDNAENRQVIAFMEDYRKAVEAKDIGTLLGLASEDYYDDSGTPAANDDVDYDGLRESLAVWAERLEKVRYEIRYRRITQTHDKVFVDFTYTGSFRIKTDDGEKAIRKLEDNRVVLARSDRGLRIL